MTLAGLRWPTEQRAPRILVLGDLMLDRYVFGEAERVSPEAPVLVLRSEEAEVRPGGAASVASLCRHLEAEVGVLGVVGDDAEGRTLERVLREQGIDCEAIQVDADRCTTSKCRYLGRAVNRHAHQILRVDHESRQPLGAGAEEWLLAAAMERLPHHDVVLVSDYAKGTCSERLLREVIEGARQRHVPVLVDPARIADYARYRGATCIKPNRQEAELATGTRIGDAEQAFLAAESLAVRHEVESVLVTLDRDGAVAVERDATSWRRHRESVRSREVCDITGAGDTVLAALGVCRARQLTFSEALAISAIAAGLQVERLGIAPVTWRQIAAELAPDHGTTKVSDLETLVIRLRDYRTARRRVVFTNGCFDLLHAGHLTALREAAALGDVLIVGVNSDTSVRRLKGPGRPVVPETDRAALVAGLSCVDHVVVFDDDTPHRLLQAIRPDVLAKGGTTPIVVGAEVVTAYGGTVQRLSSVPGVSTTELVARIQNGAVHAGHTL